MFSTHEVSRGNSAKAGVRGAHFGTETDGECGAPFILGQPANSSTPHESAKEAVRLSNLLH